MLTLDGYPHRGQPIMLTEFGGIALDDAAERGSHAGATAPPETCDELADRFEQLMTTVVHTALFSGFCYTQFADTFQEANGLLRADRSPKIPLARIARCTSASRTHIPGGV